MAEEIQTMRNTKSKRTDTPNPPSRSSIDSVPAGNSLASPPVAMRRGSGTPSETVNGTTVGPVDTVYLKNVLLQFLEQKDRKHQMQLIPVLGMLLHFDRCAMTPILSRSVILNGLQQRRAEVDVCHLEQMTASVSQPRKPKGYTCRATVCACVTRQRWITPMPPANRGMLRVNP